MHKRWPITIKFLRCITGQNLPCLCVCVIMCMAYIISQTCNPSWDPDIPSGVTFLREISPDKPSRKFLPGHSSGKFPRDNSFGYYTPHIPRSVTAHELLIIRVWSWAPAGFFPGVGKFIGVARIFSGGALFSSRSWRPFLVVALKTQAKTTKWTTPTPPNLPRPKIGLLTKNCENITIMHK